MGLHLGNSRSERPKPAGRRRIGGLTASRNDHGTLLPTAMAVKKAFFQSWQKQHLISTGTVRILYISLKINSMILSYRCSTIMVMFITFFLHSYCYTSALILNIILVIFLSEHPGSGDLETKHQDLLFHLPGQVLLMGEAGNLGVVPTCIHPNASQMHPIEQSLWETWLNQNGALKCKQAYLDLLKRPKLKLEPTGGQLECINAGVPFSQPGIRVFAHLPHSMVFRCRDDRFGRTEQQASLWQLCTSSFWSRSMVFWISEACF